MTVNKTVREQVRQRANYACEYCSISETDSGGLLTIDHFQPLSKGGSDSPDNLIYCCNRCNSYKYNYFPVKSEDKRIWNPRKLPFEQHFFELDDGRLKARTETGQATIDLLRLNRSPLVDYRLQRKTREEETRLLKQYQNLVKLFRQTNQELQMVVENQQELLDQQQQLLRFLLDEDE